jgi:hypothetical protein
MRPTLSDSPIPITASAKSYFLFLADAEGVIAFGRLT